MSNTITCSLVCNYTFPLFIKEESTRQMTPSLCSLRVGYESVSIISACLCLSVCVCVCVCVMMVVRVLLLVSGMQVCLNHNGGDNSNGRRWVWQ